MTPPRKIMTVPVKWTDGTFTFYKDKLEDSVLPKQNSRHVKARQWGMLWVESVATSKLLESPYSPHQRKFCTEGLLGQHALWRTLYH